MKATWVGIGLIFTVGCASSPPAVAVLPSVGEANDRAVADEAAVEMPSTSAEDSAADIRALEALRDLEFGPSDSSSLPFDTTYLYATDDDPVSSARGGAASAEAPTYDIDIESFATNERVEYYVDFFLDDARDRFNIWLGRLNRYEGMIRNRFRAAGVPEDLVYLAAIESGYSNTAVSRASAVGMWQFMSYTARDYGMVVDEWVDERRDPFTATNAAARYLANQYDRFGSWYLAAAAYNGGPTRVSRGLRRLSQRGDTAQTADESFFRLSDRRYLRRETRDYVPKLIAATQIAKNPARYGFDSIPYLQPLVFDEITVPDATGLDVIANLADTTTRALVELNPAYYRGVTPPRRESIVRVPRGTGTMVARRYEELPAEDRVNFVSHRISRGETLGGLARRYLVSLDLLVAANPGIQPRRLSIGQRIVIPLSSAARSNPGSAPRMLTAGQRYHLVRWGETMSGIAQRYRVRLSDLLRWNAMRSSDVLRAGRRLIVRQ